MRVGGQLFGVSVSNTPRSTRLKRCVLYVLFCNTAVGMSVSLSYLHPRERRLVTCIQIVSPLHDFET